MLPNQKSDVPYGAQSTADMPSCPRCDGALLRIWRRPVDRMTSWVVPVRRYRCQAFCCQWEGNFRAHLDAGLNADQDARPHSTTGYGGGVSAFPSSFVVSMILAAAGMGFIVVATGTDWLDPEGLVKYSSADDAWRIVTPESQGGAQAARTAKP